MKTSEERIKDLNEYKVIDPLSEWGPMFKKPPTEFSNWINSMNEVEIESLTNGNDTGWEIQYLLSEKMIELKLYKSDQNIAMAMEKILKAETAWLDLEDEIRGVIENDIYKLREKYLPENIPAKALEKRPAIVPETIELMIRKGVLLPTPDPVTGKYIPRSSIPETVAWIKLNGLQSTFNHKLFSATIRSKCKPWIIQKYYRDV
jgi:hypothetical protein